MPAPEAPLKPPYCLGIVGNGQLGRMLALAARHWGVKTVVWGPEPSPSTLSPAAQVCDAWIDAPYDETAPRFEANLQQFAQQVQVVTYEFENLPLSFMQRLAEFCPVKPGLKALETAQNRLLEKAFLQQLNLPTVAWAPLQNASGLPAAEALLQQGEGVLKTAQWGYDGKGQQRVANLSELKAAWEGFQQQPCILEQWTPFERELSLIGARGASGEVAFYPLVENVHENHILSETLAPAPNVSAELQAQAQSWLSQLLEALDYEGVLAMELFALADGRLLINELAPRPHNSGHWTIEGSAASQFEQHLRAVLGWPLLVGPKQQILYQPTIMRNVLGQDWPVDLPSLLVEDPGWVLHDYGKTEAKPDRKMGHLSKRYLAP
jgi:5-(carboxyamino)imidazole ribonucleotide synthase